MPTVHRVSPSVTTPTTIRIYLRRSDERKQAGSIAAQRSKCDALAGERYPGCPITYYIDGTGKHSRDDMAGHTDWLRLVREVQPGDVVVVYERSRIGADLEYALAVRDLGTRGATLIIAADGSEARMQGGISDLLEVIHGLQNKEELNKIRSRTKNACVTLAQEGYHTGGLAPFGYAAVADESTRTGEGKTKMRLALDPAQAEIVLGIATAYLSGRWTGGIARDLNAAGVPGPIHSRNPRGVWQADTVGKILRSPLYRGSVEYAGVRYPRPHLMVIREEMAEQIDARIASRRTDRLPPHAVHPLAGLGVCAGCGGKIHSASTGRHIHYVCGRRQRVGDCSVATWVRASVVESVIASTVAAMLAPMRQAIKEALASEVARSTATANRDTAGLEKGLIEARKVKARALKLALASDDPDVATAVAEATGEVRRIEREIDRASSGGISASVAARIEAEAVARLRELAAAVGERETMRDALRALFPHGLLFTPVVGGWAISGDLSALPSLPDFGLALAGR